MGVKININPAWGVFVLINPLKIKVGKFPLLLLPFFILYALQYTKAGLARGVLKRGLPTEEDFKQTLKLQNKNECGEKNWKVNKVKDNIPPFPYSL